jgi:hypothetical protein
MTIEELLRGRSLTSKQMMAMRTAHYEDEIGFERIVRETATANSPAAALVARIHRGEHRTRSSKTSTPRQPRIGTLDQAVDYAHDLYRSRITAYPPVDEPGWRADDHIGYAADRTAYVSRYSAGDIEHGLRERIGERRLRSVS